jgi:carboxymethylenebutenolidase
MCFEPDAWPPVAPAPGGAAQCDEVELVAADGARFRAVHARGEGAPVIVLPDARGLHPYYVALAQRLAEAGFDALAIDYYGRTAGIGERGAGFAHREHSARLTWAGLRADIGAAAAYLGPSAATVGFCVGGRFSLLAATEPALGLARAVAFYPQLAGAARNDTAAPIDTVDRLRCPVLALFGGADALVPAADVAAYERAVAGRAVEVVVYPGAPHSFFDRAQGEHAAASADAWRRILAFLLTPA